MRFWDSSALVPLLVAEPRSAAVARLGRADPEVVVAWTATIEGAAACARRHRERLASASQLAAALGRLREVASHWNMVEPTAELRTVAERLVGRHGLRSGDAIQLASAVVAEAGEGSLDFVCFDNRLALAAAAEGLRVVPDQEA
jgi:predicted nucleic acid-binding protein